MKFVDSLPRLENASTEEAFFQVLLDTFSAKRDGDGLEITVALRPDMPVLEKSSWKRDVAAEIDVGEGHSIEADLDAMRRGEGESCRRFEMASFRLRHASAGVLAIRGRGPSARAVLFHRDIPPVGWNIANGASSCPRELHDVTAVMLRESAEELLFFDTASRRLLCLESTREGSKACELWADRLNLDEAAPLLMARGKRHRGPDTLVVVDLNGHRHVTEGLHVGVHAEDFGIECTTILHLDPSPGRELVPLDGEILGGQLLDRNVGLVRLEDLGRLDVTSERLFRGGEELQESTTLRACPVVARLRQPPAP